MKKKYKILLGIIIILIGFRIYLPYWVKDYVNKVLDEIPGHQGSIQGVGISLLRGAYRIDSLIIEKTDGNIPVPFLNIEKIDLSVHWGALFDGEIVGEVILFNPIVNFVVNKSKENTSNSLQVGKEADWTEPLKKLIPLQINLFTINNGEAYFKDYTVDPIIDLDLKLINLNAKNLSNTEEQSGLPSTINASATSIGNGKLNIVCKANVLRKIPDLDLNLKFEEVYLPSLNKFTEKYAKLDFEKGTFNLYTEIIINDGILEGYVKPILNGVKVFNLKKDSDNGVLKLLWEGLAGAVMEIFENQPKDQFATQVPLEGNLNDPDIEIWTTITNTLKNAFVEAFKKDIDGSISFDDLKTKKK